MFPFSENAPSGAILHITSKASRSAERSHSLASPREPPSSQSPRSKGAAWNRGRGSMGGPREEEDYPDEVEERLVNEEYKIWKKNTPFLYGARALHGMLDAQLIYQLDWRCFRGPQRSHACDQL